MRVVRLNIKNWINLVLLLLVMGLIFFFSSQPAVASAKLSGFFAGKVLRVLEQITGMEASQGVENVFSWLDHYVRKFGHFTEYFILGLLASNLFCSLFRKRSKMYRFFMSGMLCSMYAISDEVHQIFVPGRGPGVGDVLLDSVSAALAAVVVVWVVRE